MSGELRDAIRRAGDRKEAAGLGAGEAQSQEDFEAMARRIFVGLDIDLDELLEVADEQRARAFATVFATGMGPGMIGAAMWLEGLLSALLLMDARNLEIDGGGGTLKPVPLAAGAGGGWGDE